MARHHLQSEPTSRLAIWARRMAVFSLCAVVVSIIIDRRPPQAGRPEGHIEAVARTLIMGLRDDVVVRVRGGPDGSRIDLRSSSRFGSFDFGSNAARIRSLINDIDDAVGNEKPEPAVLPVKKPPAPAPQPKRDQRDQPPQTSKR